MSWIHVARKDFEDAIRSMMLWALSVLMILTVAGISAIPHLLYIPGEGPAPGFDEAMSFMFTWMTLMISIIGLVVGYQAIVKERESGTIRFLLGLPNTRRDVVFGKVLGRSAVVAVPTAIGFLVGAVVIGALYDGFGVADYVGLFAFSILIGLVYVSVAVGVSAAVSTRAKAVAGVLGIYVVFDWIWWTVPMGIYWILERELPGTTDLPAWYLLLERFGVWEPLGAIASAVVDIAGVETVSTADRIAGDVPFYLETWFAWVFVAAWIIVPLGIGYYRFNRAVLS
ncbi:ABC transporter [Halostagnicola larsenii XH-48]|uniref:ABC transporter n=1 Tax=Halostagnicola larsenii XH-48 TaxID=797299 RepID=W0JNR3_9EURY|nr:ABC transporter permease [Halostagnicola larsenii]AHG00346.1 ABC transporter [Halostagnicola larsenii XH-48]